MRWAWRPVTCGQCTGVVCGSVPPRTVLLRAVGRGLPANVGSSMLPFPVLTLYDGGRSVAEDRGGALALPITTLARSVGAFPLNVSPQFPGTIYGSALALTLGPGAFTAMTSSGDTGSGVSLFEFYDSGAESAPPLVRNVAIRGQTAPGAAVLTAGCVISGNGPLRLLIRGLGPALSGFGLAGVVADPTLTVHSAGAGAVLATNDGWAGVPDLANAARAAGAFPLWAASRDAALVLTVEPGAYTVQLISASGASGAAMIEIYVLDD